MISIKIDLPEKFLNEEVRSGYTISQKMKEVWAVQMDMLKELERVCQKYNLTYYADSGTLIGAIRHKGYIPWDDDIDLVMKRRDYQKLLEVAYKEFKHPYFFQTAYSDKDYIRGHAQIRNSETTAMIKGDESKPFNRGIFIDIFPMDNLPDEERAYSAMLKRIKLLWRILQRYQQKNDESSTFKGKVLSAFCKVLYTFLDYRTVFRYYENVCSKYSDVNTQRVSYIAYSHGKEKHIWKSDWFAGSHRVPFEFMDIVVPDGFDERLKKEYGDYMAIRNVPSSHGETVFDTNIPYSEFHIERYGYL